MSTEESTHQRVLGLVVSQGPISAADIAARLGLTPAGVRRHLGQLTEHHLIAEHALPGAQDRGRGRPARAYVATAAGQRALGGAYANVAVDALAFLRDEGRLADFVSREAASLENALAAAVPAGASVDERVAAVAAVLDERGYAPSVRPLPGGLAVQLCQGHCPVQSVAEAAPEWCEEETRVLARVLGVHVQRLSTLAGGAHVCTTNIPLAVAGKESA